MASAQSQTQHCLVTGGSGFLGKHLVDQLLDTGKCEVTVFDIRDSGDSRVKCIVGDLRKIEDITKACEGKDIVFHVATAQYFGGEGSNAKQLMHGVNVTGTQNVIDACISQRVPKLIYTSTASVVFEGKSLINVDESVPYAARPMDYYTGTKIQGEQLILKANGAKGTLATCALRPSGLFGKGDTTFWPTVVAKANQGKMKYIIGSGDNLVEFTYVGNVAQAHLQAAEALDLDSRVAGEAYFITNDDPRPFWEFLGNMLEGLGYPPRMRPHIKLPYLLIYFIALVMQYVIIPLLKPFKALTIEFTPSAVTLAACTRRLSCRKAREHFGYIPSVSMKEAQQRSYQAFPELRYKATGKKVE